MTFFGVILAIVFAVILWMVFPLFLSRFEFLVSSPINLFISRTVGSIFGGFMFSGLLIGGLGGSMKNHEAVKEAIAQVVVINDTGEPLSKASAKNDPQHDLFYFDTPVMGLHLGMTISQLQTLLGDNKDALKIPSYIREIPGEDLVKNTASLFTDGTVGDGGSGEYNGIVRSIFGQHNSPYGVIFYELSEDNCPVKVENIGRIELTFIGGRLAAISTPLSDIAFNALTSKYERTSWKHQVVPDSYPVLRIGDKECALAMRLPNAMVNVPYVKALIKHALIDVQKKKEHDSKVKQQTIDNI